MDLHHVRSSSEDNNFNCTCKNGFSLFLFPIATMHSLIHRLNDDIHMANICVA